MSAILKFIRENHMLALIEQAIVKKKSRLNLNAFEITDIPNLLYTCSDVEHLYLHKNKISRLSVQIVQLANLTILTLDYNNITSLPPEIRNLKNLVNLNISYNPLKVLIPEIGELENLEALWCNKIELKEIPKEIGKLSKLDTFGARGNELKTIPEEMTNLSKLRWLTLENNVIETLPDCMDKMEALVHCNLRNNRLQQFPASVLKCQDLIHLQLNNNQISNVPEEIDTSQLIFLEMIDLRGNPVCELTRPKHQFMRFAEELPIREPSVAESVQASARGIQCAPLTDPPSTDPPPTEPPPTEPPLTEPPPENPEQLGIDVELEASSAESSEDWENSLNSSELDVQYQSEDDWAENEVVGVVLPELSRYAST